ncbi:polysaccharide deacetylase family protein [Treponema sp. R80B11-R83G3]
MDKLTAYIIDFLARFPLSESSIIHYGKIEDASVNAKIIIIPAFHNFEITSLPETPFKHLNDTPILYGNSKIEKQNGKLTVYADIIASSFFLLSRYEEILKQQCRDHHGRFLAKDSVVFQQGYGNSPLVDEYGVLLRKWLREIGANVPAENKGFGKICLTHDVDEPFHFSRLHTVCKQYLKNLLKYNYSSSPFKKYLDERYDEYYTFPKIINYDKTLRESLPDVTLESIYFFITAGSFFNTKYYNFFSKKINRLINLLIEEGARPGLHISYEAGKNPKEINYEVKMFKKKWGGANVVSRHHYLQWREPEDIVFMEQAGINDDFTLSYADSAGFRVGTCRPYRFINPKTKEITNVIIHPLEIMECTLNLKKYMNLDYEKALSACKEIIDQVYKHNGELVLLWHNTEFTGLNYQEKLYISVLEYIKKINK